MNSSEFSVKGKIYIGFDVSQKTIKVFAVCGNQACQKAETIRNSRQSIADFLKTCFPEAFRTCVVMETGTHALWMSRLVEAMGYETIVAHARDLQLIYATEKKNDAIDAERLAKLAQYDRKLLHPVRLMDEARQRDFAVMKARDTLVRQRTTIVNTVRGLLRSFGEDDAELTVRNMKDAAKTMPPDMLDIVKPLLDQLKTIDEGIKKYDRKIERLCRKYKPTDTLRQVKGVGPAIALAFVLVIGDPRRFPRGAKACSYLGLVPKQDQSGEMEKQLNLTKCGNSLMRRLLIQGAQYIMGSHGEECDLRRFGMRIASRGGKTARKKAKVAVARKLVTVLLRLWSSPSTPYNPNFKAEGRKSA